MVSTKKPAKADIPITIYHCGRMSAVLDREHIRWIRFGRDELVRGIGLVGRDLEWETLPIRTTQTFAVRLRDSLLLGVDGRIETTHIVFAFQMRMWIGSTGHISVEMTGVAEASFTCRRLGLVVLLPADLAGKGVAVISDTGRMDTRFPERIAPHQPLRNVVGLDWQSVSQIGVQVRFREVLMEMEDQRNWGEASFKFYNPPIGDPPLNFQSGKRVRERVDIELLTTGRTPPVRPRKPPVIEVATQPNATAPSVGLCLPSNRPEMSAWVAQRIRRLAPSYLRAIVDLNDPDWKATISTVARVGTTLSCPTELELIANSGELVPFAAALDQSRLHCERLLVFPTAGFVTERKDLETLRQLLARTAFTGLIGGGSRTAFAELNESEVPIDLMQVAGYPISPQVHAEDLHTIVESLDVLTIMARDAHLLIGDLPLTIGPITLRPRLNVATGHAPRPTAKTLGGSVDPRQSSLFCAAWTLGVLSRLATTAALAVTLFETHGMAGVVMEPTETPPPESGLSEGPTFPVYHVLADILELKNAGVCPFVAPDGIAVFALRRGARMTILLSELCGRSRSIQLRTDGWKPIGLRMMTAGNLSAVRMRPDNFRAERDRPGASVNGSFPLRLEPYAYARIDAEVEDSSNTTVAGL